MALVPSDKAAGLDTPIWAQYKDIINAAEGKEVSCVAANSNQSSTLWIFQVAVEEVERFKFYDRAKNAFAVVATG